MASSSYATIQELSEYLPGVSTTDNNDVFTALLDVASRLIDEETGSYFYDDGISTKYFNSAGLSNLDTGQHPFWGKSGTIAACGVGATTLTYTSSSALASAPLAGDVFTLDTGTNQEQITASTVTGTGPYTFSLASGTAKAHAANTLATSIVLTLAYFENQPTAQWIQRVDGDGVTPPSNWYAWPQNRPRVGSTADPNARRPFYGIDLAHIPLQNTTYLPAPIVGYYTWGLTAHWGWPVVPSAIKHICLKATVREWQSRSMGWALSKGSPEVGVISMRDKLDDFDHMTLSNYSVWSQG